MNKKNILIIVYRGSAELDWILPILYKLSSEYKIFTLFNNEKAYESLKKNDQLYKIWKSINFSFYVHSKYDFLLYKLLRKILTTFKWKFADKINEFFSNKIHDLKNINNKFFKNNKNLNFDIVFSEWGVHSGWLNCIKNKLFIVHYPSAPRFLINRKDRNIKKDLSKPRLDGNLLLLSFLKDKKSWSNAINEKKIKYCGIPKYDDWWINKIINLNKFKKKNINDKKIKILLSLNSLYDQKLSQDEILKFDQQFNQIFSVIEKLEKVKLIIKPHPVKNHPKYLKILENFKHLNWEIRNENLTKLSFESDIMLSWYNSAAIIEGLVAKIPSIELWHVSKRFYGNYNSSVFSHSGLSVLAKDHLSLERLITKAIKTKNAKIWKKQFKKFDSIYGIKKNKTQYTINLIKKERRKFL